MSCEAKRLPKPPLQGYLEKRIARNLAIAFTLGISGAAVVYLTVCVPLEKAYEEYNKNLDVNKLFDQIQATGAFTSCKK